MKQTLLIITTVLLLSACTESMDETPNTTRPTVYQKAQAFPQEDGTIYGVWMDTSEIYVDKLSMRRWFYISRDQFGIGQWCFHGKQQSFSTQDVPAMALNQTLIVQEDIQIEAPKGSSLPCLLQFPKGHYGINLSENILTIIFPQTGEIITAVRYYAPVKLAQGP